MINKLVKSIQNNNHKKKLFYFGRDDDVGGWEIAVKLLVIVLLRPGSDAELFMSRI